MSPIIFYPSYSITKKIQLKNTLIRKAHIPATARTKRFERDGYVQKSKNPKSKNSNSRIYHCNSRLKRSDFNAFYVIISFTRQSDLKYT
jgi:hypothetical protein